MNPVVYIFLNKSLHMSSGKAAAQAAHAAMVTTGPVDSWKRMHRTIIVLEGRDERHMDNIQTYLSQRGYKINVIVDEGANEIDPHTITALSTNILDKDDEDVQKAFSSFKLYRDTIKINMEFEK